MSLKSVAKRIIPNPVRHLGWRGYHYLWHNWLATITGCQTAEKVVALTFDDGPNPDYTPPILEILARYQIKATFFMIGENVVAHPQIAREVVGAGHAIGNHTFTHPRLVGCSPAFVAKELFQCQRTIRQVTDVAPNLMRPPFGAQDPLSFVVARLLGYAVVHWSTSAFDWRDDSAAMVADRVVSQVQAGGVILMHDGFALFSDQPEQSLGHRVSPDRTQTIAALPMIIEPLQSQGYQFLTLPEMLQIRPLEKESWFV